MKQQEVTLKLSDHIALDIAMSSDEGDKINVLIRTALEKAEKVILDFSDINIMTTAFLNAAIGQLYKDFSSDILKRRLSVVNLKDSDITIFKLVTNRAKDYFGNNEQFSKTVNEVIHGKN